MHSTDNNFISMDANDLINNEQFFYADCVVIGPATIRGYTVENSKIKIDESILINQNDVTEIARIFAVESNDVCYAGGEAFAHGSFGFFFKTTQGNLDWALMSEQSNPFVSVEIEQDKVSFVSTSGAKWVVHHDDIMNVAIEG